MTSVSVIANECEAIQFFKGQFENCPSTKRPSQIINEDFCFLARRFFLLSSRGTQSRGDPEIKKQRLDYRVAIAPRKDSYLCPLSIKGSSRTALHIAKRPSQIINEDFCFLARKTSYRRSEVYHTLNTLSFVLDESDAVREQKDH